MSVKMFLKMNLFLHNNRVLQNIYFININISQYATYRQGQSPEPKIREYFYYIDHQGMLFLDDARIKNFTSCFKDKQFLKFFFSRLRKNNTQRYITEFPYLSICGTERNYIHCDDVPIVFTKVISNCNIKNDNTGKHDIEDWLSYAHADHLLMVPFMPHKLFMNINTGRVYHPASEKVGGIGLIRSALSIEFSNYFVFEAGEMNGPTHFFWKSQKYKLDDNWFKDKIEIISKATG